MELRHRRLAFGWLAVYAILLAAAPFEHHDLLCELKTPLHCRACTSGLGSDPARPVAIGASTLRDLGVAFAVEVGTDGVLLSAHSTGRSPPRFI